VRGKVFGACLCNKGNKEKKKETSWGKEKAIKATGRA
jgi:hypothetical protein